MTAVLSDQSRQISTTLTAWDEFEKRCSKYFPEDARSHLDIAIGYTFSKIKILNDRLEGIISEISRDQSTVSNQQAQYGHLSSLLATSSPLSWHWRIPGRRNL